MTQARVQSVLLEADGPLLLVLRDAVETAWLATCVERGPTGDAYLCIPISPSRLAMFRHGDIDLRSVFTDPQIPTPARMVIDEKQNGSPLTLAALEAVPKDWLPDAGFFLTTFIQPVESEFRVMVSESVQLNRPVVYLNLNPPEAKRDGHVIDADRLGRALTLFQNGIKHAATLANRVLSTAERKRLMGEENYMFEVFAFARNSFEVHMQAKAVGDVFGYTAHVSALQKFDEIAAVVNDTNAAVEVAKANRGHFVSAVTAIMEFVSANDTPVSYAWTTPLAGRPVQHTIQPTPALALYEALVSKQELTRQEVSLVGVLRKVDEDYGTWRLESFDGEMYTGDVEPASGVVLHDLNVGVRTYAISCIDVLSEATGSGRESHRLRIVSPPIDITGTSLDPASSPPSH